MPAVHVKGDFMDEDTPTEGSSDWRNRMTISVQEFAKIVGVGRNTAYQSVRAGEVATIRVGGAIRVCVSPLLKKSGAGPA